MNGTSPPSREAASRPSATAGKAADRGRLPVGETNPPAVPRQGRAIAGAIAREPPSLRTGRALTGAVRRIMRSPRGGRPKSRLTAAFASVGNGCGSRGLSADGARLSKVPSIGGDFWPPGFPLPVSTPHDIIILIEFISYNFSERQVTA